MDIFTQKKFLVRIVILLIILNLFSISLFLWRDFFHKPPPPHNEIRENREANDVLKKELDLTDSQDAQIKNLRSIYFEKEKVFEEMIRNERDSMNVEMFSKNVQEETVKALAKSIADNEYKIEMLRFEQSQKLKSLCKKEQLEKFESLILEIRDFFRPDGSPVKEKEK